MPSLVQSSQFSLKAFCPSPQVEEQTEGEPVQKYPYSRAHAAEQPSLFARFPSSQTSLKALIASPQDEVQTDGDPMQLYPVS